MKRCRLSNVNPLTFNQLEKTMNPNEDGEPITNRQLAELIFSVGWRVAVGWGLVALLFIGGNVEAADPVCDYRPFAVCTA